MKKLILATLLLGILAAIVARNEYEQRERQRQHQQCVEAWQNLPEAKSRCDWLTLA